MTVEVRELTPAELLAEGFHARLNTEALAHTAVIYLVHNNGMAGAVPLPMAFANPCLVDLAPAFRIRGARVRSATLEATLARAREVCASGHGPFLIEHLVDEERVSEDGR